MKGGRQRAEVPVEMPLVGRLLGATRVLDTLWKAIDVAREELALALCDELMRAKITTQLYRGKLRYHQGSAHNMSGLFRFESAALQGFFPAAPARLLVGGCGGGREVFALIASGYQVVAAYDPAPELVAGLAANLQVVPSGPELWVGGHEAFPGPVAFRGGVDGVIIGWGSYTHLLGRERRIHFLKKVLAACPAGPVLLSFFVRSIPEEKRRVIFRRAVRTLFRKVTVLGHESVEDGDCYEPQTGFSHRFVPAEVADEAHEAGYRVVHYQDEDCYPHAVLLPVTQPQRA